ncbi:MAG TPA: hypothetical protein VMK83_05880 [Gaiellaceae bacterium]|nr:hypothetical protein [Gaiellaceae bacterium]
MRTRLLLFVVPALAMIALVGVAYGSPSQRTDMDRTKAAGWDCTPEVPIAGQYLHCAPPGKPSVADLLSEAGITVPSLPLRVFNYPDESFAGIESLIRADLYQNQPCPQDAGNLPGGKWSLLELPSGNNYSACHRFERTST